MKNKSTKVLAFAAAVILISSCNKKDAQKGEKDEGIYYNERSDQNGSSDTTANTNQGDVNESGQNIGNDKDSTTVDGPKGSMSNN